jgi:hypothetical protein
MKWAIWLALPCIIFASTTRAGEIRVTDDAGLARALREARAGDVVRVAPGAYRGGLFATLQGEQDRPIVIEGSDPDNPPVIKGGTSGLQISGGRYVTLRNLTFLGATGNGLNIDDGGAGRPPAVGISIERVRVGDVGPRGNTDGIKLSGLSRFRVADCVVEGWGGNAIDLVGCSDGVIERCVVRGKDGFDSATGPQLKGGTHNVTIRHCFFDHAGQRAVNAGGSTGLPYFRPIDAAYEARDLTIEHNVFVGSTAPVAFVGVDGALFRNNTLVDPGKWVLRILQESTDKRFVRCRNVRFERNLIVYKRAAVRTVVNIGPNTSPESFSFTGNWWWCSDGPTAPPLLPTAERDGVVGRDPRLKMTDSWAVPTAADAHNYGAKPRK